ncbi:Transmembrane protease serine 4 [Entomophthora muscae]|uniref:Transmembrane protease serine 4 n=1 Tax=Entomophthora muscae TaxID=34485 RepID=A0ACC2SVY3_9FUNG|nr:Transmembrane protease serine 4 [Entomophthora muscae]
MQSSSFISILIATIQAQAVFPSGRIVGGHEVTPKFKYPWIASLQYSGSHTCGGTWYSGNAIISAAHCVIGSDSSWTALVHRHNLHADAASEDELQLDVISRVAHPDYDSYTNAFDVSVWKVNGQVSVPIIALDSGDYSDDTLLTVVGWGFTRAGGFQSYKLLEIKVPVFNSERCQEIYHDLDVKSQFCAGYPEGKKDSCQGDSGGPIFVAKADSYTLVGVVSWGRGCATKGHPGVYTRTSAVADFIASNI